MKKLLAITMIFVMLMAASSFATKTRVLTMGDNNMVLLDEANIFIFPSRLYQYPDMAVAEISSSPFISVSSGNGFSYGEVAEFGVHWKFGTEKPWVLGTYLFNSDGQTDEAAFIGEMLPLGLTTEFQEILSLGSSNWGEQPNLPFFEIEQSNRRLGLVYSRELGGNLFGFGFDYLHSSCKDEDVDVDDNLFVDEEETFARYKFSFGLTEAAGMWDVAAHVSFVSWTDTEYDFGEDAEYDETKPDGNMTLAAKGRYFHQYNPTITFVPHVGVAYSKFGTEAYDGADDTEPEKEEVSGIMIYGGSGMHYTPAAGMLAVLDVGIAYTSVTHKFTNDDVDATVSEDKFNFLTLPFVKVGFEGEVFNWLDLRLGATSYWRNLSYEETFDGTVTDKESYSYPNNRTYLGFAFNFGNLTVDTWTSPQLFTNGFNFISGQSSQMNAGLSALYQF